MIETKIKKYFKKWIIHMVFINKSIRLGKFVTNKMQRC